MPVRACRFETPVLERQPAFRIPCRFVYFFCRSLRHMTKDTRSPMATGKPAASISGTCDVGVHPHCFSAALQSARAAPDADTAEIRIKARKIVDIVTPS